jgi:hypothetical protein
LARATNCQFSPAPATELTVFPPDPESVEMNASNNSLGADVEKLTVLIEVLADELSPEAVRSIARELPEVCETAELLSPKREQNAVTRSTQTCKRLMRGATFFFRQVFGQLMQLEGQFPSQRRK